MTDHTEVTTLYIKSDHIVTIHVWSVYGWNWVTFFANESCTSTACSALYMLSAFMYIMWCLAPMPLKELPPKIITKLGSEFGYDAVLLRLNFLYGHCMVSVWSLCDHILTIQWPYRSDHVIYKKWPYTDHTCMVSIWSELGHFFC